MPVGMEWTRTRGGHSLPCRCQLTLRWTQSFSLVDLRCQVELHEAIFASLEVILHQQGGIRSKPELHGATEGSSLREIHQVPQSECRGHRLLHSQCHSLLCLFSFSWLQHDIATTRVTLHAESNAFLAGLHLHRLAELLQVPANPLELCRWQPSADLVLLLWNLHVLALYLHQLQIEVSDAVVASTLALETDRVSTTLPAPMQGVSRPTHFQDLREGVHIHP